MQPTKQTKRVTLTKNEIQLVIKMLCLADLDDVGIYADGVHSELLEKCLDAHEYQLYGGRLTPRE